MEKKPNVLLILNDDMGYSDIGCYGGEIETPNLDRIAKNGLRYTQFYNTARCSPSRASLLTGLHPHQTGIGILTYDSGPEGYAGDLNNQCVTIAEVLQQDDYKTYMSGKWHVANSLNEPSDNWPLQRGFDEFYGTIIGAGSYYNPNTLTRGNENIEHEIQDDKDFYYTDAISDQAVEYIINHNDKYADKPFFQYVAYTAPHWPLQAKEEVIAKYKGKFSEGWDVLREERLKKLIDSGILKKEWKLTDRDPSQPAWQDANDKEWLERCMEVYAAQIDVMDQGIGRILKALEQTGELDNTLIMFLSDNGACAEDIPEGVTANELVNQLQIAKEYTRDGNPVQFGNDVAVMPGQEDTYQSYGTAWANLSNSPFRLYKHWVHEGGISTPFIIHWPDKIKNGGELRHTPSQLTDVMATILDVTEAEYPAFQNGNKILKPEGVSLKRSFESDSENERPLFFEHEGNAAVRFGKWKLVRKFPDAWELFDMEKDRTELNDIAKLNPEKVNELSELYNDWAKRCGVIPREKILELMNNNEKAFWEKK